ncbi:MAG: hypothetical protein FWC66_07120 [Oscillospiraceae bacterium]|nr:hypothetical protein [Oscillospiraceae bacterium]
MKKIMFLLLATILCISIFACGTTPAAQPTPQPAQSAESSAEPTAAVPESPPPAADVESYEITHMSAVTWATTIGTVWAQVIVEVENTGTVPLFLRSGAFDVEDASGALIASQTMVSAHPNVIAPGEKGYYYDEFTLNVDTPLDLVVIPRLDVRRATVENIRFAVSDFSLSDGQFGDVRMIGRVENTHDEEHGMVYISVILFDDGGTPIGALFTILIEDFAPGDRIGFEGSSFSLPTDITADDISSYAVFAYPLQMQF